MDILDLNTWVRGLAATEFGDTDLNGVVDVATDGQTLVSNLGDRGVGWAGGDFDGDGVVTASQDGAQLLAALASDTGAELLQSDRRALQHSALHDAVFHQTGSTWD